jgi:predicted ATPase
MRYINEIEISGFRCYEQTRLSLQDLTILTGPNNSGKSAFLHLIRRFVSANLNRHPSQGSPGGAAVMWSEHSLRLENTDNRDGQDETSFVVVFGEAASTRIRTSGSQAAERLTPIKVALRWPLTIRGKFKNGASIVRDLEVDASGYDQHVLRQYKAVPSHVATWAVEIAEMLPIVTIPESRSLALPMRLRCETPVSAIREDLFTANDLLPMFLDWQCTGGLKLEMAERLASRILAKSVRIKCSPREATIFVAIEGARQRRLEDLGSGITEVLTLAMVLSEYDGGMLLYEEPELHLHPDVQKRCLDVLHEYASTKAWQILATSHSEYMLSLWDKPNLCCAEVIRTEDHSKVVIASDRENLRRTILRLGAEPSSVLAAKTVIWVEGPSDAIYLAYFIEHAAPQLVLFKDFAFAFFGGSLLKHTRLSSLRDGELVDLFSLQPNSFVVFDSDRPCREQELGKEYARRFEETAIAGRVWATEGREIENYLPDSVLTWAATGDTGLSTAGIDRDFGVFYDQVKQVREANGRLQAHRDVSDKAAFAIDVVKMLRKRPEDPLTRLDLRARVEELIRFIRMGHLDT